MVLLIDTNIVLDVLLNRPEFVKDSSMIWKLCETEQAKGYISTLTYANMMYVMRKQLTPDQIEEVFRKLNLIFEFADFSPAVLERAVNATGISNGFLSPNDVHRLENIFCFWTTSSVLEGSSFRSLLTSFSPDCVPLIDLFTLSSALESFVVSPPISTVMPWILDAICVTTSLQA